MAILFISPFLYSGFFLEYFEHDGKNPVANTPL
jgi:hypothetical protein